MVGIIDYGMGNILSVKNAFDYLGEECKVCENIHELNNVNKIVLPGVGSFPDCMENLKSKGFFDILNKLVLVDKIPILGICLGMQIMAKHGYEIKKSSGLGWLDAEVVKISPENKLFKVPNIGWETVEFKDSSFLFNSFRKNPEFYFVHSYFMSCFNLDDITSWYNIDQFKITASIQKENIFGTQFHPEKSSDMGLDILINFMSF